MKKNFYKLFKTKKPIILSNGLSNFDDLNFEFGTTTLTPESQRQLNNIVVILKAFPDAKLIDLTEEE